jgi:exosortase A
MPPDASLAAAASDLRFGAPSAWRAPLMRLTLAWALLIALAARDWAAMAHQWFGISTYNHIVFVPPIAAWLVWLRRRELAKLTPEAWWPGLALLAGALFVWLLGTLAGLDSASQLGAVAALIAVTMAVLGPRVGAALAFPLGYLLFLVPFGDELVPVLQTLTAKGVVALAHLTGMEARIDGVFIHTRAGLFEVAEACSGVEFLVAMVALGALAAERCFTSWRRRVGFLVAAILLPIVANAVRAWGTIAIAQVAGLAFAAGFDHIFYGWIFFALVVAILLAASWRWFDRAPDDPGIDAERIAASPLLTRLARLRLAPGAAIAGIAAMALGFAAWSAATAGLEAPLPSRIAPPQVAGWHLAAPLAGPSWSPRGAGAGRKLLTHYRDEKGRAVDLYLGLYAQQAGDRDAAAFGEGALTPGTAWRWLEPAAQRPAYAGEWLLAQGHVRRLAQTSYRTGGETTGSAARFKLRAMRDRLLLRAEPATVLILSSEGANADSDLAAFRAAAGDLDRWMDRAAGLR